MARQVPQDRREFVRVAVDLPTHEKLCNTEDPPLAGWLFVTGLCSAGAALSDGEIAPRAVVRKAGVPAEVAKWLVAEGLWHEPGHDCPRCPQPREGKVMSHDYLRHNRSRAQAEAARNAGRQAAAARWSDADGMPSASGSDSGSHADRISGEDGGKAPAGPDETGNADRMRIASGPHAGRNAEAEAEAEVQENPLLTLIGRLAGSDARASDGRLPAEVIASWQRIAGPDVALEDEAAAYFSKQGGRPARDEAAAWVGWLKQANRHAAKRRGVPAIGCTECLTGWLPDEYGYASERPCPTCKPHIAT
jgi:hypothetical protein